MLAKKVNVLNNFWSRYALTCIYRCVCIQLGTLSNDFFEGLAHYRFYESNNQLKFLISSNFLKPSTCITIVILHIICIVAGFINVTCIYPIK